MNNSNAFPHITPVYPIPDPQKLAAPGADNLDLTVSFPLVTGDQLLATGAVGLLSTQLHVTTSLSSPPGMFS
jgi:hypothetical protein